MFFFYSWSKFINVITQYHLNKTSNTFWWNCLFLRLMTVSSDSNVSVWYFILILFLKVTTLKYKYIENFLVRFRPTISTCMQISHQEYPVGRIHHHSSKSVLVIFAAFSWFHNRLSESRFIEDQKKYHLINLKDTKFEL